MVFQLYDSLIYFSSLENGELVLPKRGEDGRYHIVGELVLAEWTALKKIFNLSAPLLRAAGKNLKIILSALPRYVQGRCCNDQLHLTNFGTKEYATEMGNSLAQIHSWLDDLAHGKRITEYMVMCVSSAIGLEDIVVVETPDAVLVSHRNHSQAVKKIVSELSSSGRGEHTQHRKVHRPWGWYDSIDMGDRFQVKRIMVKPGASLSLQMHHHRAEHWIVVRGTAEVRCGEKTLMLTENQSTYIPLGETHRLANPGKVPLEIIEVQSGSYLGEDDIVRFEDTYGRQGTQG